MIGIEDLLKEVDQDFCSIWNHGNCAECDIHRGKDGLCEGYSTKPNLNHVPKFKTPEKSGSKTDIDNDSLEPAPKIKITLVDVEHNTSRTVDLNEAKTWDWKNPEMIRLIGDWQVKNYEALRFILSEKERKGLDEVKIYESPRFMLLCGG